MNEYQDNYLDKYTEKYNEKYQVDDIIQNFVSISRDDITLTPKNSKVYHVLQNEKEYLKQREQFKNYIEKNKNSFTPAKTAKTSKTTKIPKSEKTEKIYQTHKTSYEKLPNFLQYKTKYLNIDSRDRNTIIYPNANKYLINVSKFNFSNIVQIKMISSKFVNISTTNEDIYIRSFALGHNNNNFSIANKNNENLFGKIQLTGFNLDVIYNSFVGCEKNYYDNSLNMPINLDFEFRDYFGNLVDFGDTNHSFVLQITELVNKCKKSEFNTKLGITSYTQYQHNCCRYIGNCNKTF